MLGTLLGAGGSFLGGLFDGDGGVGDANAYNMMLNRDIRNLFREMGQREALSYREATGLFNERLEDVMGTLDRAEAQVGQGTRSALRNASDQSQQAQAAVQQNLRSRGLGNSSIAGNAQRGIASDLARNVGDIYAQEGRTRAGLGQARAGFQSSLMGDIASLPLQRNASAQNRLLNYTGALENMAAVPSGQTGGFGDLFGGIGSALGEAGSFGNLFKGIGSIFS
ncbi:MAG: hypothetical protein ACX94C_07735 [Phycisphaerales bacterium]